MLPHRENLLRSFSFIAVIVISMLLTVETRYLRPSDHGINYQNNPTDVKSPEMMTFFGGASTELPEAKNSSEPRWRNIGAPASFTRSGGGDGKDRVRETLLVASLACGVVGVALMVAAAFIYLLQRRRSSSPPPPSPPPPPPSSSNSCKQIVVYESS
ncbi:uncharacterized protein LOC122651763 [Telopea speciosissima]|uniref:uncharacterized protein LOC122651763 n=1 Tax=Telopea speciosissima TaxID=54955 RepID=UPI001CC5A382|nr:uncharacterized protein LOC122651763 [Telopea speciosissima]